MGYSRMIGTHILTPSGRQQYSNYAQIIAAVVNITLNSLLIPRFFAKGAAVASVTAELVLVLVYYRCNRVCYCSCCIERCVCL